MKFKKKPTQFSYLKKTIKKIIPANLKKVIKKIIPINKTSFTPVPVTKLEELNQALSNHETKASEKLIIQNNNNELIKIILSKLDARNIVIIGDSHTYFLDNLENIFICHLGPVTAHNLCEDNSSTRGRIKLFNVIKQLNSNISILGLSFGEIDIRVHIIKSALKNNISIEEALIITSRRYLSVVSEIIDMGFKVILIGPHSSGNWYINPEIPHGEESSTIGKVEDRNQSITLWNKILKDFASINKNCFFASLSDLFIDPNTLLTRNEFLSDGCHAKADAEIQSILLSKFLENIFENSNSKISSNLKISKQSRCNLSIGKKFKLTSSFYKHQSGIVKSSNDFFFHTNKGKFEGIIIDLDSIFLINEIILWNRLDSNQERAFDLEISFFDGITTKKQEIPNNKDFLDGLIKCINVKVDNLWARKIFIYSKSITYLHLSNIEIFGPYIKTF